MVELILTCCPLTSIIVPQHIDAIIRKIMTINQRYMVRSLRKYQTRPVIADKGIRRGKQGLLQNLTCELSYQTTKVT